MLLVASAQAQPSMAGAGKKPEVKQIVYKNDLLPATVFTLPNGLTLIVHEDHDVPVVAVNVWYHVGSKDEPLGKSGFAHLFEHLMFNGTENFNQDYFKPLERAGATNLNGTTNNDRTNYFQTVPVGALDTVLWLESDRMGHLLGAIDIDKLDEQRDVVKNEKRQGEDRPYGKVWGEMAKGTFPYGHPYSWSVIGSMEDLTNASLDDVHNWFKQYYGPNNATIVLAGAITPEHALERVLHFFGDIPPGPDNPKLGVDIAPRFERVERTIFDKVTTPRVYMVWNTPPMTHKTAPLQDILSDMLANGRSSILHKKLVTEEEIATQVAAFYYDREIAGQMVVIVDGRPDSDLGQLEREVHEAIKEVAKSGGRPGEIEALVKSSFTNVLRGLDNLGGFGGKSDQLARSFVLNGNPAHLSSYLHDMRSLRRNDFKVFAKKWLQPDGVFSLRVLPSAKLQTVGEGADRSQLPRPEEVATFNLGDWERGKLANGLEIVVKQRTGLPLVDVALLSPGGIAASSEHPGIASFTWSAMTELGTRKLSGTELSYELLKVGASISSDSGLDSGTLTLQANSQSLEQAFKLFAELIRTPNFRDSGFERLRKNWLVGIDQERENGRSMAFRAIAKLLYPEQHPYHAAISGTGDPQVIADLDSQTIENWYATWVHPQTAKLVFVGDITFAEARAMAERQLGNWRVGKAAKTLDYDSVRANIPAEPTVYVIDTPDSLQSTVMVGQVLRAVPTADEAALEVANATLGGTFTSRINMNLREDKGWSYGARSRVLDAAANRPFVVYAGVQTDKTFESLMEMKSEIERFISNNPPTAQEVDKIKESRSRRVAGSFETIGSLMGYVTDLLTKNRQMDYITEFVAGITSLSNAEVRSVARRYIKPEQQIYLIVGDYSTFKDKLAETAFRVEVLDKSEY